MINGVGFNIQIMSKDKQPINVITNHLFNAMKTALRLDVSEDRVGNRRLKHFLEHRIRVKDCAGCGNQVFYTPNGLMGVCQAMHNIKPMLRPVGVIDEDLWGEWNKRAPLNINKCLHCPAIGICGGGCLFNSFLKHDTIWALDETNCEIMKRLLYLLIDYEFDEKCCVIKPATYDFF